MHHRIKIEQKPCKSVHVTMGFLIYFWKRDTLLTMWLHCLSSFESKGLGSGFLAQSVPSILPLSLQALLCLRESPIEGEECLHSHLCLLCHPPRYLCSVHCCLSALTFPTDWLWLSHLDWYLKSFTEFVGARLGVLHLPSLMSSIFRMLSFIKFSHQMILNHQMNGWGLEPILFLL